jgi:hypothetical protein
MSNEHELLQQLHLTEPRLEARWNELLTCPSHRAWLKRSVTRCGGCGSKDILLLPDRSTGGTIVSCARWVNVTVETKTGKKKKELQLQSCGWRVTF